MKRSLYVRPLTVDERSGLEQALRSPDAFTLRRAQVLLASARGERPQEIAGQVGFVVQSVRNAIRAFHAEGLSCLVQKSNRPKQTGRVLDAARAERLRALLHESPRRYGKPQSAWTLDLAAEVSFAEGITPKRLSDETIRRTLIRLGIGWKRAKHWITSPDPAYARKKNDVTG